MSGDPFPVVCAIHGIELDCEDVCVACQDTYTAALCAFGTEGDA